MRNFPFPIVLVMVAVIFMAAIVYGSVAIEYYLGDLSPKEFIASILKKWVKKIRNEQAR